MKGHKFQLFCFIFLYITACIISPVIWSEINKLCITAQMSEQAQILCPSIIVAFLLSLVSCYLTVCFLAKMFQSEANDFLKNNEIEKNVLASRYQSEIQSLQKKLKQAESNSRLKVLKYVSDGVSKGFLSSAPLYQDFSKPPDEIPERLISAISDPLVFLGTPTASCQIKGKSGKVYNVTLTSCTCEDFTFRHQPCKHMYRLAVELGLLASYDDSEIAQKIRVQRTTLDGIQANLKKTQKKADMLNHIIKERTLSFPWASKYYADLCTQADKQVVSGLLNKSRPARRAADEVSRISKEKRELQIRCKQLEYQLNCLDSLFPWLEEFRELPPADAYAAVQAGGTDPASEYEPLRKWLSPDEYNRLSDAEKYQLALDRYSDRQKTNWEIGRDFERYVGYTYESRGLPVLYCGATLRLEDMGRDLIVSLEDGSLLVIQCKRYAREKMLHEKHIFQLFGSITLMQIHDPDKIIRGLFICTCALSETAKECADRLNIEYQEFADVGSYPQIKCNVSKNNGEKIYHLPFDQQYDRIVIDKTRGEFFAWTVAEAEAAGFRRAHRHRA